MFDWAEPYNRFDITIILLGYGVSLTFGYLCKALKQLNPWTHNIVLAFCVSVALVIFAWRLEINVVYLPVALLGRVYDGSVMRRCLLLFWLINVFSSVAFCVRTAYFVNQVTTSHRKFFHVTVSAVAISGFLYDPSFVVLCGHIMIILFIILEILRVHRVQPWYHTLDANMLPFLDGQDNRNLVLTPIHLIGGVFVPSLLDFMLCEPSNALRPSYYSGVLTVGVGDACAALIGSNFGRIRWGVKLRKTAEGSAAMLFGQIVAHITLFGFSEMGLAVIVIYSLSTLLEAALDKGDNIILPIFTFFLLKLREYFVYP